MLFTVKSDTIEYAHKSSIANLDTRHGFLNVKLMTALDSFKFGDHWLISRDTMNSFMEVRNETDTFIFAGQQSNSIQLYFYRDRLISINVISYGGSGEVLLKIFRFIYGPSDITEFYKLHSDIPSAKNYSWNNSKWGFSDELAYLPRMEDMLGKYYYSWSGDSTILEFIESHFYVIDKNTMPKKTNSEIRVSIKNYRELYSSFIQNRIKKDIQLKKTKFENQAKGL